MGGKGEGEEVSGIWTMRRLSVWTRLWNTLWPPARRRYERDLREGLAWLRAHPEIEVRFED